MLTIKKYVRAASLDEAYDLNQKRTNRVIGGMLWLKMSSGTVQTAIDLSGLGLDTVEETDEEFSIGAMVTLRELELHEGLNAYTGGALRESLRHIVGVQFRNLATVGGSLYGRFGFSDVLTCFLGLDAVVELHHAGMVPIAEFAAQKPDRDILVRIHVKKTPLRCATRAPTFRCLPAWSANGAVPFAYLWARARRKLSSYSFRSSLRLPLLPLKRSRHTCRSIPLQAPICAPAPNTAAGSPMCSRSAPVSRLEEWTNDDKTESERKACHSGCR